MKFANSNIMESSQRHSEHIDDLNQQKNISCRQNVTIYEHDNTALRLCCALLCCGTLGIIALPQEMVAWCFSTKAAVSTVCINVFPGV